MRTPEPLAPPPPDDRAAPAGAPPDQVLPAASLSNPVLPAASASAPAPAAAPVRRGGGRSPRRNLADVARALPLLGLALFFLPLLWSPADTARPDTAYGGLYLFAVWAGLVVGAFLLSRGLMQDSDTTEGPKGSDGGGAV
ncbi:MAG: hypothetical protein WBA91_11190 [Paracoccaceae bacterium]